MLSRRIAPLVLVAGLWVPVSAEADAQQARAARPGSLRVTVRDATDLPLDRAQVRITSADGTTVNAITNERGQASFDALSPGTYAALIEARGFQPLEIHELTVRSGARISRNVALQIAGLAEVLDVTPVDEDRHVIDAFTSQLTPDQIAALPDDPEEVMEILRQLAGTDAVVQIDGFAGAALPPGVSIQDVRIRWDDTSGNSQGGGPRIEIRTRPGGARWRSSGNASLRDERFNARNPFSGERPSGQTRQYGWSLNGPLVPNRTGVSFSIEGADSLEQQAVRAAAPNGLFSALVSQPASNVGITTGIEHALNPSHTIRVQFRRNRNDARNQGIGEFDLPDRAYSRERRDGELRVSHNATLGRRFVNDFRFQMRWNASESVAASHTPAVRVLDAFSSGGAQIQGGRSTKEFEIQEEFEFTWRQRHQIETGVNATGARMHGDEWRNASGTFTFASLDAYAAGQPTTFTQRLGDPTFTYSMYRVGWYVEDAYRLRRNLMLNLSVRQDVQTHISDWANFSPRASINWTPIPGRRLALRASAGVFYQGLSNSLYEQTLLVNGTQQRDLVVANPSYPDPFQGGLTESAQPPGIIRADPLLVAPSTRRMSVGVDQPLGRWGRFRTTYSRQTGHNLFRSRDVNAPVNGVRPDASIRTLTQLESTARSRNQSLELNLSVTNQRRRFNGNLSYTRGSAFDETDGALTLPPDSFDLSDEWGPSRQDIRNRLNASVNSDLIAGFRINAGVRAQSAAPYTITTGFDINGDGVSNERPAGVGRNSGRGSATKTVDATLTWGIALRRRSVEPLAAANQQRDGRGSGGARDGNRGDSNGRRLEVFVRAANVFNIVNPQNFSGVMTSPFFGRPISAAAARRVVFGTRVSF